MSNRNRVRRLPTLEQIQTCELDTHWRLRFPVADIPDIIDTVEVECAGVDPDGPIYVYVEFSSSQLGGSVRRVQVPGLDLDEFHREGNASSITKILDIISANVSSSKWDFNIKYIDLTDEHLNNLRIYLQKHGKFLKTLSFYHLSLLQVTGDCLFKLLLASGSKNLTLGQTEIKLDFFTDNLKQWIKYECRSFEITHWDDSLTGCINPVDLFVEKRISCMTFDDGILTQELVDAIIEKRISMRGTFATCLIMITSFKPAIIGDRQTFRHEENRGDWGFYVDVQLNEYDNYSITLG